MEFKNNWSYAFTPPYVIMAYTGTNLPSHLPVKHSVTLGTEYKLLFWEGQTFGGGSSWAHRTGLRKQFDIIGRILIPVDYVDL